MPNTKGLILAADINLGNVLQLDLLHGASQVSVSKSFLKLGVDSSIFGVNGIKIRNGTLHWTNSGQKVVAQVKISATGFQTGQPSIVVPIGGDDFTFDAAGQIFSVGGSGNLSEVYPAQRRDVNLTMFPGPTSCQLGRTTGDYGCLYVTSSECDAAYASHPVMVGGAVFSVDVFQNNSCNF